MVKVVHLQISTMSAGRAVPRLHNAMLEANIDSSILTLNYDVNDSSAVKNLDRNARVVARLDESLQNFILRKAHKEFGLYSYPILGSDVSRNEQILAADIIYLHWVQGGFLNLTNIRQLAKLGKPVIFFMHDMWSITGGCHHSFTCDKYMTKCFDCQVFPEGNRIDWANREFRKKKKLYSDFKNLYFITPSKWLYDCAKSSSLTRDKPVYHIPNIVDRELFKPVDRKSARQILNLDADETIIAFGAMTINSPYKGWKQLQKALEILSHEQNSKTISVLIFGSGQNKQIEDSIPFKSRFMGFLKDEYSTSLVYNAADIFITPSLADNLPTTILESLSCGTPVVGFEVGGIPDMIKHKENGYLARYKDVDDIAKGITFCIQNNIKGRLLPEFEKGAIIKKHLDLIDSINLIRP
jgi:glycosyltransferase involved in cell wall biosynthesis